jgi:Arc/MetJ-type ribon-helix-helix transcriptional regulator
MSAINVKLPESQLERLDAGIAGGRAGNRSEALRIALDHLLREWDRQSWDQAWEQVTPEGNDEFAGLNATALDGWSELDIDRR